MSFENHFLAHFNTFNCHVWRKKTLWRQEIDIIYSRFVQKLELVYKRYCGKYIVPGTTKLTTSLDEFTQLLGDAGLLNEFFGNREAGPLWNLSMMTNKDELNSEKHLNMTFVEFLEAIGRVSDKLDTANLADLFPDYPAKHPTKLDKKLETVFFMLIKTVGGKHYDQMHAKYT